MRTLAAMDRAGALLVGAPALRQAFATVARDHPAVLQVPEVVNLLAHLRVAGRVTTWDDGLSCVDLAPRDVREQLALLSEIELRIDAPRRSMVLEPLTSLTRAAWQAATGSAFGDPYEMSLARDTDRALAHAIASAIHHYNTH